MSEHIYVGFDDFKEQYIGQCDFYTTNFSIRNSRYDSVYKTADARQQA